MPDELEDLLRRYRPAGPPPELRARVLASARAARTSPWAAAAAALLVTSIALHSSTVGLLERVSSEASVSARSRIEFLAEVLGGGEDARRTAGFLVAEEELRRSLPTPERGDRSNEPR